MTSIKLLTRRQVNERYGLSYCAESYRRFEKKGWLTVIKIGDAPLSRAHYAEDEVDNCFGPTKH
jgi:hypothetical protein